MTKKRAQRKPTAPTPSWPPGYLESFANIPDDFARPPQGDLDHPAAPTPPALVPSGARRRTGDRPPRHTA